MTSSPEVNRASKIPTRPPTRKFRWSVLVGLAVACLGSAIDGAAAPDRDGLLPFDSRWEYPHYLTWRPANAQPSPVNPPRMSWPAVPQVLAGRDQLEARDFRLQLSRGADFAKPDYDFTTPYNFFNALPVLAAGTWHWRVGYQTSGKLEWAPNRTFQIDTRSVAWDRTVIDRAAKMVAAKPHPRLGPADGNWTRLREQLEAGTETRSWLEEVVRRAQGATRKAWWKSFPQSDRKGETDLDEKAFTGIAADLATACLGWKLTGDSKLAPAKDHLLALAKFSKGGFSSPEYNGAGSTKWPTQISEYLAVGYDWLYHDLTPAERETLRASIEWRLRAVYLEKNSWRNGPHLAPSGVSVFCQSHPFENFMWSLPAVLLLAGDLPLADELVPLCLNYLTGVTSAHGPDEAWNEGLSYGTWKGDTMIDASMHVALLLPELKLGRNPYYARLGEWYAHLLPLGIQRLSFGDYAATPERALSPQRNAFRHLSWLTGDGRCETRRRALVEAQGNGLSSRAWLDLFGALQFKYPEPKAEASRALFPEAGWVMLSTRPPSDKKAFDEAVGMIFQARPRGGFSHSYRAENDFVWHAYGQTLSAGGGGTAYPDPHSRHSISHNVVLVDGIGQEWNPRAPKEPYCGRLLAYREGEGYVHWVGDATKADQTVPGLLRWHRHVVFVEDRWFVLFDDLEMQPNAAPAKFSSLFHVAPEVALHIDHGRPAFRYRMKDVHAHVLFNQPASELELVNLERRNGFTNPLTGEDLYDQTAKALRAKGRSLSEDQIMAHNLWITNRRPASQWTLMTVLLARRDGEPEPRTEFLGDRAVRVQWSDGRDRTVSFGAGKPGDIQVDLELTRKHGDLQDIRMAR